MESDWEKIDHEVLWTGIGSRMPAAQAAFAEKQLLTDPDILELRIKLLGYYFLKALKSRAARNSRYRHICWMIQNHPDHFVASEPYAHLEAGDCSSKDYAYARELWLEQVRKQPDNSAICGSFGLFIIPRDLDFGLEMLQRAHQLAERKHEWSSSIILFCSFQAIAGPLARYRKSYAELALTYAKAATEYDSEYLGNKILAFEHLTKCALYLNEFELAAKYAASYTDTMNAWGHNDKLFQQGVLGIIALRQGNTDLASKCLLNVHQGDETYSQLIELAREMLSCNQHTAVAEFLRRLLKFKLVDFKLEYWRHWLKQIEKGKSPKIANFKTKLKLKKRRL